MVSVPLRAPPELAATLKPTVALPLPLVADVSVIQDVLLAAVHVQPFAADSAVVPVPPPAPIDWLVGLIPYEQGVAAAAAWFTVNVCPPMVSVPLRAPPELAATLKLTVALPLPLVADVSVIQDALLAAVQAQPFPPSARLSPCPRRRRSIDSSD